jgi:UDP-N-acetylmuramate--alanine ligase
LGHITLNVPGRHNVLNALAAIGLCLEFDVPFATIAQALENFKGVERRFEFKGTFNGAEIFDDYGHHPTELKTTLLVAQKRAKNGLHIVFQPHRFTRTQKLWDEFIEVFAQHDSLGYRIDTLYVTDIYPASEAPIEGITSQNLVQAIKAINPALDVRYLSSYASIAQDVVGVLRDHDLLLTIGAGKVNQVAETLVSMSKIAR